MPARDPVTGQFLAKGGPSIGGLKLTGQWGALAGLLDPAGFERRLIREVTKAAKANGTLVASEIRKEIQSGVPPDNAPLTKILKKPKDKTLVGRDAGLWKSIGFELENSFTVYAGVLKTAEGKSGEEWVNIGLTLHEGAKIKVTDAMRAFFYALANQKPGEIFPLKQTTEYIIIPPRPFVKNVMERANVIAAVNENWATAMANALFNETRGYKLRL